MELTEQVRLDEYDRQEWWDVARRLNPDLTPEQMDAKWAHFCALKAEHERNRRLN